MWLTRLSITRPVTMLMLVLALVILGLQSNRRLPVDLYPDVCLPDALHHHQSIPAPGRKRSKRSSPNPSKIM